MSISVLKVSCAPIFLPHESDVAGASGRSRQEEQREREQEQKVRARRHIWIASDSNLTPHACSCGEEDARWAE